jgi:hypothetical protein
MTRGNLVERADALGLLSRLCLRLLPLSDLSLQTSDLLGLELGLSHIGQVAQELALLGIELARAGI